MNKLDIYNRGSQAKPKASRFSSNAESKKTINHNIEEVDSIRNTVSQSSPSRYHFF